MGRAYFRLRYRLYTTAAQIVLSASSVAEDASADTLVGILSVVNAIGTPVFTLDDDAGGLFVLDGDDVEVAGALDYETEPSPQIIVSVSGVTPAIDPRTFTITVTDVSEAGGVALKADFSDPNANEAWVFW